jgi:hypothetical protein
LMYKHQHTPLPLDQLKDVPQTFVILLEALLQKDPAKRPQSPAELQTLLCTLRVDLQAKDKASVAGMDSERRGTRWRGISAVAILFVVTAGVLYWFVPKPVSPLAKAKSVAVLPFENSAIAKKTRISPMA